MSTGDPHFPGHCWCGLNHTDPAIWEHAWETGRAYGLREVHGSSIDAAHLERQRAFSLATFGPGLRTKGVIDHIKKEFIEIEAEPTSLEWIDVVILALDGAWRAGYAPQEIIDAIIAKQAKNELRDWPDWRTAAPDQAIEHVRT